MNDYCELIEKICIDTIPGYQPTRRVLVTGAYSAENTTATSRPALRANFKVNLKIGVFNAESKN